MLATLINEIIPSVAGTAVTTALITPYITGWYEAKIKAIVASLKRDSITDMGRGVVTVRRTRRARRTS